jgi:uncharacterized protein YndB with AHSA1/START domain
MTENKINISAFIQADRKKVWEYYTDPSHIIQWNFADPSWHCPKAENHMEVGGTYFARMEARDGSFGFDFIAVYTEINPGKNFTYQFGGRLARIKFADKGEGTEVTVSFDPETENPVELQRNGWQAILNNFRNYTETN